jgi:hypothetical protein
MDYFDTFMDNKKKSKKSKSDKKKRNVIFGVTQYASVGDTSSKIDTNFKF